MTHEIVFSLKIFTYLFLYDSFNQTKPLTLAAQ